MGKNEYAGINFETRYVLAGRDKGCSNCDQLKSFLEFGLDGKYDDQITVVNEGIDEGFDEIIGETKAMTLPVFVDTETGEFVSGLALQDVEKMLSK